MKLLFLTDTPIPSNRASAVHLRNLIPALAQKFDKIDVLTTKGKIGVWPSLPNNVKFQTIQLPNLKGGLLWMTISFRKLARPLSPTIIYSRFIFVPWIAGKRPYIIELHDAPWNKGFLFNRAIRKALAQKNCLGFTCITKAIKDDFQKTFPKAIKEIQVIADASNPAPSQYKPSFTEKKRLNIAYVGSFFPGKGVELVLLLAEKVPEHDFTIIGGSMDEIKKLEERKISDNIKLLGYIDHDLLWQKMEDIDICLLPNQPNVYTGKKSNIGSYTSPMKLFEYMAFSKPIIASDLQVLKEVLDTEIALLVDHKDLDRWAFAIRQLANKEVRQSMGENACRRLESNFTWSHRAEHILNFILRNHNEPS
ncbi:MAG: glycosyltransferase family 4 protein [Roseivirga sp.]|nr:glycosyltransferase family 4 protein [Roseivirga sp.]